MVQIWMTCLDLPEVTPLTGATTETQIPPTGPRAQASCPPPTAPSSSPSSAYSVSDPNRKAEPQISGTLHFRCSARFCEWSWKHQSANFGATNKCYGTVGL